MKVLYVGGLTSSQKGAVGTHTRGILNALQELGVDLHALFLEDQVPDYYEGPLTTVPAARGGVYKKIVDRLRIARAAARCAGDFDFVYARYDPAIAPFMVGDNVVLEYNDDFMDQIRFAIERGQFSRIGSLVRGSRLFEKLVAANERRCFRRAKMVVGVTQKLCDLVAQREPRSRTLCMLNGSDAFYDEALDPHHRDDVLRIGHIGTITYWDGLAELVTAIGDFRRANPERAVKLLVVGDEGPMKPELVALVRELGLEHVVEFRSNRDHKAAIAALHEVDLVPLLKTISSYDLSPIKFYEALCTGRFLLCSDIRHINEVDPASGLVVSFPLDVAEISEALLRVHERLAEIRSGFAERSLAARRAHAWTERVGSLLAAVEADARGA